MEPPDLDYDCFETDKIFAETRKKYNVIQFQFIDFWVGLAETNKSDCHILFQEIPKSLLGNKKNVMRLLEQGVGAHRLCPTHPDLPGENGFYDVPMYDFWYADRDFCISATKLDSFAGHDYFYRNGESDREIAYLMAVGGYFKPALSMNDMQLIRKIADCNPEIILEAPDILQDRDFAMRLAGSACSTDVFMEICKYYDNDDCSVKELIAIDLRKKSPLPLNCFSGKFLDDFDFVKNKILIDTYYFCYASPRLLDNEDFVKLAIGQDVSLLQYASARLRDNDELVKFALGLSPSAYKYASLRFRGEGHESADSAPYSNNLADFKNPATDGLIPSDHKLQINSTPVDLKSSSRGWQISGIGDSRIQSESKNFTLSNFVESLPKLIVLFFRFVARLPLMVYAIGIIGVLFFVVSVGSLVSGDFLVSIKYLLCYLLCYFSGHFMEKESPDTDFVAGVILVVGSPVVYFLVIGSFA